MSGPGRIAIAVGSVVAVVVLFFVFRSGGDDSEETTTTVATTEPVTTTETGTGSITVVQTLIEPPPPPPGPVRARITVAGGEVVGGRRLLKVTQGKQFVLIVNADVSDHVHLHGYDLMADVAPGKPARIRFKASIAGRFEIELEDRAFLVGQLEVRP